VRTRGASGNTNARSDMIGQRCTAAVGHDKAASLSPVGSVSRIGGIIPDGAAGDGNPTAPSAESANFIVIGYEEEAPGRLRAIFVAEEGEDGVLIPAGCVESGLGRTLWEVLRTLRRGRHSEGKVPVKPRLRVAVGFFGRDHAGMIRDAVLLDDFGPTGARQEIERERP
jgi:hypothetical protein